MIGNYFLVSTIYWLFEILGKNCLILCLILYISGTSFTIVTISVLLYNTHETMLNRISHTSYIYTFPSYTNLVMWPNQAVDKWGPRRAEPNLEKYLPILARLTLPTPKPTILFLIKKMLNFLLFFFIFQKRSNQSIHPPLSLSSNFRNANKNTFIY